MTEEKKRPQITLDQREKVQEHADEYLPVDAGGMSFTKQLEAVLAELEELKNDGNDSTHQVVGDDFSVPDDLNTQQ